MDIDDEVVIIGAGICGLATALALHRKGINNVVMERSETLRNTTGAAIGIRQNGWRALDQLGVAETLRRTAILIHRDRTVSLDDGKVHEILMKGEFRCLRRKDLIDTLYDELPSTTVKFGCQLESIKLDPNTSKPVLRFSDGSAILAKVLIGCDGGKSIVADFLNVKPTKKFSFCAVRGLSNYPNGHSFDHDFVRITKDNKFLGIIPIDDHSVYWTCAHPYVPRDERIWEDLEVIRRSSLDLLSDYPREIQEMIEITDAKSLWFSHIRYRTPWDLLMGTFCKGPVTVAGDAMHVMGPFLGQGGSAGLEDAVVLARNLAQRGSIQIENGRKVTVQGVEGAFHLYVKQRKMRVVRLSLQTYLTGMLTGTSSRLRKFIYIVLLFLLFRNPSDHMDYDCGRL
ncbi:monooxygenase 1-like [Cynara cardunculus var. scolymus]|uniref:monooxygenase 1-like n=1 Tax=Cynara cardunculus var. scolymus TaxID=59895 RepID=UPI000D630A2F|nr:monooxygenase 1-like [Cynara cardunculus var. scolymus]